MQLKQFFVTEAPEGKNNICPVYFLYQYRYEIDGKERQVNAVNYFREGIKPTWEDE